jgi:hypothetical protein
MGQTAAAFAAPASGITPNLLALGNMPDGEPIVGVDDLLRQKPPPGTGAIGSTLPNGYPPGFPRSTPQPAATPSTSAKDLLGGKPAPSASWKHEVSITGVRTDAGARLQSAFRSTRTSGDISTYFGASIANRWPDVGPASNVFALQAGFNWAAIDNANTKLNFGVASEFSITDILAAGVSNRYELKFGPTLSATQKLWPGGPELYANASFQFSRTMTSGAPPTDKLVFSGEGGLGYTFDSKVRVAGYLAGEQNWVRNGADVSAWGVGAKASIPVWNGLSLEPWAMLTVKGFDTNTVNGQGLGQSDGSVAFGVRVKLAF